MEGPLEREIGRQGRKMVRVQEAKCIHHRKKRDQQTDRQTAPIKTEG